MSIKEAYSIDHEFNLTKINDKRTKLLRMKQLITNDAKIYYSLLKSHNPLTPIRTFEALNNK